MSVMCFNGMHYNRIRIRITSASVSTRRISIVVHFSSYIVLYGLHFGQRASRSAPIWDCSFVKRHLNINCLACTQIRATVKMVSVAVAIDWLWQMATNALEFIAAKPDRSSHIQKPILSNIRKYNIIQFIRFTGEKNIDEKQDTNIYRNIVSSFTCSIVQSSLTCSFKLPRSRECDCWPTLNSSCLCRRFGFRKLWSTRTRRRVKHTDRRPEFVDGPWNRRLRRASMPILNTIRYTRRREPLQMFLWNCAKIYYKCIVSILKLNKIGIKSNIRTVMLWAHWCRTERPSAAGNSPAPTQPSPMSPTIG